MKTFFKRFAQIIGVLLLLIIGLGLYLTFGNFDIEPQDFSDMKIERRNIPKEQNALYVYRKAWEAVTDKERLAEIYNGEEFEDEELSGILHKNREVFKLIDKGEVLDFEEAEDSQYDVYSGLSFLLEMQSHESDDRSDLVSYIRFVSKVTKSPMSVKETYWAAALKHDLWQSIVGIIPESKSSEVLQEINKQWHSQMFKETAILAVKCNFKWFCEHLDSLSPGGVDKRTVEQDFFKNPSIYWKDRTSYSFQPERVKRQVYDAVQKNIPLFERDAQALFVEEKAKYAESSSTYNEMGRLKSLVHLGVLEGVYFMELIWRAKKRLLPTLIAIRLYQLDNGRKPSTLVELVPKYLTEVPKDPFNGGEFKYRSRQGLLYSVGPNKIDDQGRSREDAGDRDDFDDIVIRLN